jgi:hypothetical protein
VLISRAFVANLKIRFNFRVFVQSRLSIERQLDDKRRAFALAFAVGADFSAVSFDD